MTIKRFLSDVNFQRLVADGSFLLKIVEGYKGELELSIRDNYLNLYYQGNSLAKIDFLPNDMYKITINNKFVSGTGIESERFTAFTSQDKQNTYITINKDLLHPLLQKKHVSELCSKIKKVDNGEEITFEQMIITDNLSRPELIIIDRQVTDSALKRKRMDLLALLQVEESQYEFCVIEVKLGNNPELKEDVAQQLDHYVSHIGQHFDDYKKCYEKQYSQKKALNFWGLAAPFKHIEIVPGVKGMVVVVGYSGLAAQPLKDLKDAYPSLLIKPFSYRL